MMDAASTEGERPLSPDLYNASYFLDHMDGANEFCLTEGQEVSPRLAFALRLAAIHAGERVVDIGCGRGEASLQCAIAGSKAYGLDFSWAALQIARNLQSRAIQHVDSIQLGQAAIDKMPYVADAFDAALMFDVVEHLYPKQLLAALTDVHRVLRPGGRLIIHTMPSADYYRWGYPVYRWLYMLAGRRLPKDPRKRWYHGETHVNIQSTRSLSRALKTAGFVQFRVWLQPLNRQRLLQWCLSVYPVRWVLCNDILAVAIKV